MFCKFNAYMHYIAYSAAAAAANGWINIERLNEIDNAINEYTCTNINNISDVTAHFAKSIQQSCLAVRTLRPRYAAENRVDAEKNNGKPLHFRREISKRERPLYLIALSAYRLYHS